MSCTYIYQGKRYSAWEFADVLASMPVDELAKYLPKDVAAQLRVVSKPLPDTITIDGVERPTRNSNGQPIHPTEEGIRNFYAWFGDSKVVDDQGRPLVVYHGTGADFNAFDKAKIGNSFGTHNDEIGFHFSTNTDTANKYALRHGGGGNVMPAYVKLVNPLVEIDNFQRGPIGFIDWNRNSLKSRTISNGNDGLLVKQKEDGQIVEQIVAAFSPTQIKSATGNIGTFDGTNPDIRYNQQGQASASSTDRLIFDMVQEGRKADDVLENIARYGTSPLNRQLARLLQKTGISPKVVVGTPPTGSVGGGFKASASYSPATDTITLLRPEQAERDALHEMMHAATLRALENGGIHATQMKALFNHVKRTGKLDGLYGMRDVDEFVAEAFTNPKFQAALREIDGPKLNGKPQSAWDWFVQVVRAVLGMPKGEDNALSQALEIGLGVMQENREASAKRPGFNQSPDADREFAETERAYGGREAYDRAKANGKTKLNYRQWVQVRTPKFKEWFGDWEAAVANASFNAILRQVESGAIKSGTIIQLGTAGRVLNQFGIPPLKIEMTQSVLSQHMKKHGISFDHLRDLAAHVQAPIAVFKSKHSADSVILLTEIQHPDGDLVVALQANKERNRLVINDIRSIHPKPSQKIDFWIDDGLLIGVDESRGRHLLSTASQSNSSRGEHQEASGVILFNTESLRNASKVVDQETGEPLVVYHGTGADFAEFDIGKSGITTGNTGFYGSGAYFSEDADYASGYALWARKSDEDAPNVVPAYLSIHNPAYIHVNPKDARAIALSRDTANQVLSILRSQNARADVVAKLENYVAEGKFEPFMGTLYNNFGGGRGVTALMRQAGFDGVTVYGQISGVLRLSEAVAFDPTQIKSATGNNGDFDQANPDIRYNVASDGWAVAEPSKMDDVIYSLQDKQVDMKRVVEAIRKSGQEIADEVDPYLQEELFYGRAAKGVKDFLDFELRPLLQDMEAAGVDMGDFEEFLWNRHAQERNEQIAKVNPDMPDKGSGIATQDAIDYLDGLDPERRALFERLAERVDTINESNQRVLVESGLETQATINAWNGAYQHYVPLQREDVESGHVGTGAGFSIRGSSTKRAMGSGRQVVDIIANLTMQRERNIVRAEKNRMSNALFGLAQQSPNPDFWKVDEAPTERVIEKRNIHYVTDPSGERTGQESTRIDEAERMAAEIGGFVETVLEDRVVERVVPGFKSRDNVVLTRINGQDRYIVFNERDPRAVRMALSVKNLDVDNMGKMLSIVGKATRYLASVNTQYNPIFGIVNIVRDVQGALINLQSTPLAGKQTTVLRYTLGALKGIYQDIRAHRRGEHPTSEWAELFEEFQKEGAQTGYRDQFSNAEQRAEAIVSEMKQAGENVFKKGFRAVFGWLSDYNEALENAVRLATYKTAKEQGLSNQQAAHHAKNITVNFNRKGSSTLQIGALYAFFNASVQGTARIAETIFERGEGNKFRLTKLGQRVVAGGVALGALQALALWASGFDDDEPPKFVRERSLVIPLGDGKYFSLPMPLGFHVLPGIGRIATEFALSGGKDPAKRAVELIGMFAESFNPMGSAGVSIQTLTPSVVDPFAALAENKDFTGREIYRENFSMNDPQPGHARAKDIATVWSLYISEGVNWLTGGTEFKPGAFSPSPDAIDYLFAQATGGVGREVNKVAQTFQAASNDDELPLHKIPLVGRFIGDTTGQSGETQKFYSTLRELNMHNREIKGLTESGRRDEARQYKAENPEHRLIKSAKSVESQVRKLREERRAAIENDDNARVRQINDRINQILSQFNERASVLTE